MTITIEADDRAVLDALRELLARIEAPRQIPMEISETLTASTKQRFENGNGPDGEK
jgi:phage gpG-like protein